MDFHVLLLLFSCIGSILLAFSSADEIDGTINVNVSNTALVNNANVNKTIVDGPQRSLIESLHNITEKLERSEIKRSDALNALQQLIGGKSDEHQHKSVKSVAKSGKKKQKASTSDDDTDEAMKKVSITPGMYFIRLSSPAWYLRGDKTGYSSFVDTQKSVPTLNNLFSVVEKRGAFVLHSVVAKKALTTNCGGREQTNSGYQYQLNYMYDGTEWRPRYSSYSSTANRNELSLDILEHSSFAGQDARFELFSAATAQADVDDNEANSTGIHVFISSVSSGQFVRISKQKDFYADVDSDNIVEATEFVFEPISIHINRLQKRLPTGRYYIRVDCRSKHCYLAEGKKGELIARAGKQSKTSFKLAYNTTDGTVSLSPAEGRNRILRTMSSYSSNYYGGSSPDLKFERCSTAEIANTKFELKMDEMINCGAEEDEEEQSDDDDTEKAVAILRETKNWRYLSVTFKCPAGCSTTEVRLVANNGSRLYFEPAN